MCYYYYCYYYRKKRFRWHNVKRLQGHLTNAKNSDKMRLNCVVWIHCLSYSCCILSIFECRIEGWWWNYCCRWRKPKREQLATRQYIDEYRVSQASTADSNIVVYRGIDESSVPERRENSILQCISVHTDGETGDQISLLCCEENNLSDVDVTVA